MWIFVFRPPRDLSMLIGPFVFRAPVPSGCTSALVLSRPKQSPSPPTASCSRSAANRAARARRCGTSGGTGRRPRTVAEPLRQRAPFAAVLQDLQDRVDEVDVRNPHVPALNRQEGADFGVLFCCGLFHDCEPFDFYAIVDRHLSADPSKILVLLTGPISELRARGGLPPPPACGSWFRCSRPSRSAVTILAPGWLPL